VSDSQVQFENLSKHFGKFIAVDGIDLEITRGEFVALMGPSGCGKTTTLRMLAGLEKPTDGTIKLSGRVMNELGPHERDTPMVWQTLALFPFLNVQKNVEFGLKMRGIESQARQAKASEWIDRLGLSEFAERNVEQLSGGQRQRVALARALVTEPDILLLDEPLSALDAHLVVRMQGELKRLQAELGITFFYVTHSQSEAFAMADRVVIMNDGKIAQVGTPRDIYRTPANRFVAEFIGRNNLLNGTLVDASPSAATLQTPIGEFSASLSRMPLRHDIRAQQQMTFVIGADRIQLSKNKPDSENKAHCTLLSEQFTGSFVTLFFETSDGTEFKVELQQRELETLDLNSNDSMWLYWASDDVHILVADSV